MSRIHTESYAAAYDDRDRLSGIIGILVGLLTALAANLLLR